MNENVLILHGLGGSGPEHWQTWLAARLAERGIAVAYPDLPDPDEPSLEAWLDLVGDEVARLGPSGLTVVCHSLGAITWLHLATRSRGKLAERALLVAPPSAGAGVPEIAGFMPAPLNADAAARAAGSTRIVCAPSGDPYRPEGPDLYVPLGVPVDLIDGGGHLNPETGYGPWPAVEAWCCDPACVPVLGR